MADSTATTNQLVAAGAKLLINDPVQVLDRGLNSEDVVNEAGSSQATFYRRFSQKADFLAAVVDEISAAPVIDPAIVRQRVRNELERNNNTLRPSIRGLVNSHFQQLTDADAVAKHLLGRVFSGSRSRTTSSVSTDYRHRDDLVLTAFETVFDRAGVAFRRPFTARSFAATVTALIEGFQVRSRGDSGAVSPDTVTDALLALVGAAIDASGSHQHMDDVLAPLDDSAGPHEVPRDPRAAFIAVARAEFGKRGYFMTRIDDISRLAGVPVLTARKLFPTKPHILVAALRTKVAHLTESVADDVLIGLDEVRIVENYLLRCAQLAADETAFMDALLVAVAHDTYGEPEGLKSIKEQLNLPAIIAPTIQQGQDNGAFTSTSSPFDIAAGITNTLLHRCFTRRALTPQENATFIGDLLLRGLVSR